MSSYCLHIVDGGAVNGCAFLIAGRYAITAAHCVEELAGEGDELNLVSSDGTRELTVVVRHLQLDQDLALLELRTPLLADLNTPPLGQPASGDDWTSSFRPALTEALIGGRIQSCDLEYELANGNRILALQLVEDGRIGDYSGYSGGPVELSHGSAGHRIVGVLLEQHEDRSSSPARMGVATGVLVAARIEPIYDFPTLQEAVIRVIVREKASPKADSSDRLRKYRESIQDADSAVEALQRLAKAGCIPAADVSEAKARISKDLRRSLDLSSPTPSQDSIEP